MGGTSATMMDGAGAMDGMSGGFGSAGEFDASKSMVAGPDEYGSGYGMSNAQRVPDFYDDAGQPVYIGEMAGQGGRGSKDFLKKIMQAVGGAGGSTGGGGGGGGGGAQPTQGQGPMGAGQFYVDRPWNIPNINDAHPEQVNQATYKAIMNAMKMAAGGM